jgi:mitochondrial splicing suppressor protein 51
LIGQPYEISLSSPNRQKLGAAGDLTTPKLTMQSGYTCLRCLTRQTSRLRPSLISNGLKTQRVSRLLTQRSLHTKNKQAAAVGNTASKPTFTDFPILSDGSVLKPGNLLHSFSESPAPDIRKRAAFIKNHAYCPHPSHHQTRLVTSPEDFEARKLGRSTQPPAHVKFECPDCKIPVYCCEEHWADDYEMHLEVCDTLRQINEDDHDLRSGRHFEEFRYPGPQKVEEALVNYANWDVFLYTREFEAINDQRHLRQATALLTYPVTIGSILHELSPYSIRKGGRLTSEGLKSLSGKLIMGIKVEANRVALRYTLHPPKSGAGPGIKGIRLKSPPVRLFVLGARAESSLPREVWNQLTHLFPRASFHVNLIGPESMTNRDAEFPLPERTPSNPFGEIIEDYFSHYMKISTYVDYFHNMHRTGHFYPYDPYFDAFVLFHPGLGHPASSHEWEETLPMLLETKCPIICTGYTAWDMQRDLEWVDKKAAGEYDLLMEPGENLFRSLRWDLNDQDPSDVTCGNWGVWAFRGKRYETTTRNTEV